MQYVERHSGPKPSGFLLGKLQHHSVLTEAMVYARPHFGIVRLLVWEIAQKNTWVCLHSHHKTAWARPVKSTGWKTKWGEISTPLGPGNVQECAEQHFCTPGWQIPDSDVFMNDFQAGRLVSIQTQRKGEISVFIGACAPAFVWHKHNEN